MSNYFSFVLSSFMHAFLDMLQRRRSQVVGAVMVMPAVIPLLLLVLPRGDEIDTGVSFIFDNMAEMLYVQAATPLLALFFGAMLIGEDVEAQTIPYILTRPVPRSAWVAGRFLAYLALCSILLFVALAVTFISCSIFDVAFPSGSTFKSLFHFQGAGMAGLLGYGGVCMLLGALVKRPVIVGVLLIFGWQRGAMFAPGVTDFFTIEKYVTALLPGGGTSIAVQGRAALTDQYKAELAVSAPTAFFVLLVIAIACIALTSAAVLSREYTTPTAVTE